ncbi:hypothetical protein LCGC14_1986800 [marine sediment metagenome]|uniref:Uncharacterized protein n=1 Tax=marine sediment metagenome TaxID=412755 RepID=A0A0F9FV96_9ZZZZ
MPDMGDRTWYNGQVEAMEANAHLIAAAPAMYEWIKRVVITKDGWVNQADLDEAKGILKEIDNVSS